MTRVAVLDYGMGNLHSVAKALETVGADQVWITRSPERIEQADRLVLPGQGAMRDCMAAMTAEGIDQAVRNALHRKPLLGICVGMQALLGFSEENGGVDGLGLFPGTVRFFGSPQDHDARPLKVPHMGWNEVWQTPHPIWEKIPNGSRFYFVHSYYCAPENPSISIGQTEYGLNYCSALAHEHVVAVQFHPEKSARHGLQLLANFLSWNP